LTFEDKTVLLVVQVFAECKYEKCVPYIANIKESQITHTKCARTGYLYI